MAVSSPSNAPEKKRKWLLSNRKVIDKCLREARAILAAAPEAGGGDAVAALGLVDAALELSPRMEAALELRARALLALRRYREVAEMLRDYIPSCGKSCSGDETSSSSAASLLSSGSGDLGTISRAKLLSPDRHRSDDAEPDARPVRSFRCFDISELKRRVLAGLSKNPNTDTQWRYLVLGQACFHLGLIEDAMVLLQTGRRLVSAAFRREGVGWSDDSFLSSAAAAVATVHSGKTSKSGSAFIIPAMESEAVSQHHARRPGARLRGPARAQPRGHVQGHPEAVLRQADHRRVAGAERVHAQGQHHAGLHPAAAPPPARPVPAIDRSGPGGVEQERGGPVAGRRRAEHALDMPAAVRARRGRGLDRPHERPAGAGGGGQQPRGVRGAGAGGQPRGVRGAGAGRVPAAPGRVERVLGGRGEEGGALAVVLHRRQRDPRGAARVRRVQEEEVRAELEAVVRVREPPRRPLRRRVGRGRTVRGGGARRAGVLAAAAWGAFLCGLKSRRRALAVAAGGASGGACGRRRAEAEREGGRKRREDAAAGADGGGRREEHEDAEQRVDGKPWDPRLVGNWRPSRNGGSVG